MPRTRIVRTLALKSARGRISHMNVEGPSPYRLPRARSSRAFLAQSFQHGITRAVCDQGAITQADQFID